jgi:hypothetical protein
MTRSLLLPVVLCAACATEISLVETVDDTDRFVSVAEDTDTVGDTDGDPVVPVNVAPTCYFEPVTLPPFFESGHEVSMAAVASDADQDDQTLEVKLTSDIDGELFHGAPSNLGEIIFVTDELSAGRHNIELLVTDAEGEECVDALGPIRVVMRPEISITLPTPSETHALGSSLKFTADVSDHEDDPSDLTVAWVSSIDGSFGSVANVTHTPTAGAHLITATVTDTDGLTAEAQIDLLIDSLPTAPGIRIDPANPVAGDPLTAVIVTPSTDADGDPITYGFEWTVDGSPAGSTSIIASGVTERFETWEVVVVPDDGLFEGPAAIESVTIENQPPTLASLTLDPALPAGPVDIHCIAGATSDPEGDAVSVAMSWQVNGIDVGISGDTLPASTAVRGDYVTCLATPNDGYDDGPQLSVGATLDNVPPVLLDVEVSQVVMDVSCVPGTVTDADGDYLFTFSYAWEVDGVSVGGTTSMLDPASYTVGSEVVCTATPNDGFDDGVPATSATHVVTTPLGDHVLWYDYQGRDPACGETRLRDGLLASGATQVDYRSTWPASINDYGLIFLGQNADFETQVTPDLAAFVAAGGTLVAVGDYAPGSFTDVTQMNDLLFKLGFTSHFVATTLSGAGTTLILTPHTITDGLTKVYSHAASCDLVLAGATELVRGADNQPLIAVEDRLVLFTDNSVFCEADADNLDLIENLFSY